MQDNIKPKAGLTDPARLQALDFSALMDTAPEEVFDRVVRLATQITGRPVALLSLVDDKRQFFKAQMGLPDEVASDRGTPLSHSFCQHVVTSQDTLMVTDASQHPLVRDNGAVKDLGVAAYLGVPVRSHDGDVLGALCVIDRQPHVWTRQEQEAMADLRELVEAELTLRHALKANELLLEEFNHRIRNLFAVVGGMVRMTARSAKTTEEMSKLLTDRLSAMDVAQKLVAPTSEGPRVSGEHADLSSLIDVVLRAYHDNTIEISETAVQIGRKAATAFALIVQELATNSVKYGALATATGRLKIDFVVQDDTLVLIWCESLSGEQDNTATLTKPKTSGFGTTLLKINIEGELNGTQERIFAPGEMRLTLRFPMSALVQ